MITSIRYEELDILLNDLFTRYGYDFTEYSRASLQRRVQRLFTLDKFPSFAEFRHRLQNDPLYFRRFVEEITVNVTEMLRDPSFYRTLRTSILPVLATYPFIRIWHAGCSTGEEVYSMAIILKEAGLLHKSLLYGTDINPLVIEKARKGIFPVSQMQKYSENYIQSGGIQDFSAYYTANYHLAKFDTSLTGKMIFSTHNLVSDSSFNEFQLILCRNVLIYFERNLQSKVFKIFDYSLENFGYLALGSKESLRFSPIADRYRQIGKEKIWRKVHEAT
ncbi:protein-glutamate O-methyltransferase CheR [Flavitalea sp. BT771]|uniref:CheR family methyltransferase n=1 Tax=Flavitalea sp. BT771 TaxID=3063329 RepID=UPI0026E2E3CD|nr:protein-glutamate O-methyltransferase CheR [Flavitalea sp. BT771]MDO6435364.1 protein-glutamate O-methyltransferase CheR [Flavitalea sp. BT771]MDV6224276.1 protein-glutamate O-methyltransferase CheR [Flavitalea sp. BT771]